MGGGGLFANGLPSRPSENRARTVQFNSGGASGATGQFSIPFHSPFVLFQGVAIRDLVDSTCQGGVPGVRIPDPRHRRTKRNRPPWHNFAVN